MIAAFVRLRRWAIVLGRFALVQSLVQAATLATGIVIVRAIGKEDYAHYTLANSWLAALLMLSNSGVTDAATAIGGRVWNNPDRLGEVIRTAASVRRWLCATSIAPTVVLLAWTLIEAGANIFTIGTLTALVALAGVIQIDYGILVVVPRLRGEVRQLQSLDLIGAFVRLGLTVAAAASFLDSRTALGVSVLSLIVQYVVLRRWLPGDIRLRGPANDDVRHELRHIVNRQWPNELNGVFQGQISILLLSFFGTVSGIAELGALNRIGIVFTVLGSVMQSIVLPRYARCQEPERLRALYTEIMIGMSVIAVVPAAIALVAPHPILWILGPRYEQLSVELFLVAANAGLSLLAGASWNLNTVRAWFMPWWIAIPRGIAVQLLLMPLIGVSTVRQVLLIALPVTAIAILTNVGATLVFSRGFTHVGSRRAAFGPMSNDDPG